MTQDIHYLIADGLWQVSSTFQGYRATLYHKECDMTPQLMAYLIDAYTRSYYLNEEEISKIQEVIQANKLQALTSPLSWIREWRHNVVPSHIVVKTWQIY